MIFSSYYIFSIFQGIWVFFKQISGFLYKTTVSKYKDIFKTKRSHCKLQIQKMLHKNDIENRKNNGVCLFSYTICFGLVLFGFLGLEDRNFGIQYYTHLC